MSELTSNGQGQKSFLSLPMITKGELKWNICSAVNSDGSRLQSVKWWKAFDMKLFIVCRYSLSANFLTRIEMFVVHDVGAEKYARSNGIRNKRDPQ